MTQKPIDELLKTAEKVLRDLDYSDSVFKRYLRYFRYLKNYMVSKGLGLYDQTVGENYLLSLLREECSPNDYKLTCATYSINVLNDILNGLTFRKKRKGYKTYPFPGELGELIQLFLEEFKIEIRPAKKTQRKYITSLSHFAVRMQHDGINSGDLNNNIIDKFTSSLQNTKLYVCQPIRRFLRYLFENKIIKKDLSISLMHIKAHRPEKLPSIYSTEEIRKMDTSIEKSSAVGKRDYAIFLLASLLGLRASDISSLQFHNLDWDRHTINLIQSKTKKEIELPLLNVVGEAIINYIHYGRPKLDSKIIFLTAISPHTAISSSGLSSIISNIIYKAGIDSKGRHHGTHCLRHSLATRMLSQGTTLPVISGILGHSDSQTTMTYLNVDVNGLIHCSLDVPPVSDDFYLQKGGWFYE